MGKVFVLVIVSCILFIAGSTYAYNLISNIVFVNKSDPLAFIVSSCAAQAGYICLNQSYNASTGNLILTTGQLTGVQWSRAKIYFVSAKSEPNVVRSGLNNTIPHANLNLLPMRQYAKVAIPVSAPVIVGTPIAGYIWISYTIPEYGSRIFYLQMATISARAT